MIKLFGLVTMIILVGTLTALAQDISQPLPEVTPEAEEILRDWTDVQIVNEATGEPIEPGFLLKQNDLVWVIGWVESVNECPPLEAGQSSTWVMRVRVAQDREPLTIILGNETISLVGIADLELIESVPTVTMSESVASLDLLQFIEYLRLNPNLPIILEYPGDLPERVEGYRTTLTDNPRAMEMIRLYDLTETATLISEVVSIGPVEVDFGQYATEVTAVSALANKIWAPGFHEYVGYEPPTS